jgi:acetyl-CoA carboxylase carboxyl transferase subunit beta
MTTSFTPIHGDRTGSDDPAVVAGFASLAGEAVVIVGQNRPHDGPQGSGWIRAGGFRKATRAFRLAEKFHLPVITLIDTPGAHPGLDSEEEGQGPAIAECTATMLDVAVPTIAVITGEGNSEAAVAMAVADRVLMLDNAVYEVIRPEEAAKVLVSGAEVAEVAERLRITSHDCLKLGVVDASVPEPGEGAHTDHTEAALLLRRSIVRELTRVQRMRARRRLQRRYERYRGIGSTRSWVRGTLERRFAHLLDRVGGAWDRMRGRSSLRRRIEFGDNPDIPV